MDVLYTKNGRPLVVWNDYVYDSRTGRFLGSIRDDKIFNRQGRYAATIDHDRAVYRSTDSAAMGSPVAAADIAPTAYAPAAPSAIWGDEPFK